MNKISISVQLNRNNYLSVVDKYSIYLRITINRISKFVLVPTPCKISRSEWNEKHNAINFVKATNIYAFEINGKIREYLNKVDELTKRYYLQNKTITFEPVFKALKSKKQEMTFNIFADEYIKNPKEKFELATITKYKSFLKHLNSFNKKIYFNDITPLLVSDFKAYLEIEQNLVGSTMKSYFDKFKKIINQAEKESYLDYHQTRFLFDDARIKVNKSDRTFFEIDVLIKWNELKFPPKEKYLEKNRDIFTFQIYTGFYYNDLKILKKSDIRIDKEVGIFVVGKRDKNGNTAIIPLYKFPNANRILTRYASKEEDEFLFDESIFIEDQVYNRQLKMIAEKAGIKKNVSNKVARHTNVQPKLPEHQQSNIEEFFEDVKILTAFVGCNIFQKVDKKGNTIFYLKSGKANAKGFYDENGFTVLEGSIINSGSSPSFSGKEKRAIWLKELTRASGTELELISDYTFKSPSAASDYCTGSSTNGWDFWKDEKGQTLDEVFRKRLGSTIQSK